MTAIVGIVSGGKTWMGADSCISDNNIRQSTKTPKLWRAGGYLVGAAGIGGWFAVLRRLRWPSVPSEGYMLAGFVADLLGTADQLGVELPAGKESSSDGSALVGGAGRLWYIDSDLSVDEFSETACGAGGEAARCVLSACPSGSPSSRITKALNAVAAVRWDVAGPFHLESV